MLDPLFPTSATAVVSSHATHHQINYLSADLPSIRLLKAKQKLVGVTADRRIEHILCVIVGLVRKNCALDHLRNLNGPGLAACCGLRLCPSTHTAQLPRPPQNPFLAATLPSREAASLCNSVHSHAMDYSVLGKQGRGDLPPYPTPKHRPPIQNGATDSSPHISPRPHPLL